MKHCTDNITFCFGLPPAASFSLITFCLRICLDSNTSPRSHVSLVDSPLTSVKIRGKVFAFCRTLVLSFDYQDTICQISFPRYPLGLSWLLYRACSIRCQMSTSPLFNSQVHHRQSIRVVSAHRLRVARSRKCQKMQLCSLAEVSEVIAVTRLVNIRTRS